MVGRPYYVNVYADECGQWHYGMRVRDRFMSEQLAASWFWRLFQPGRRHVCRLVVRRKRCPSTGF